MALGPRLNTSDTRDGLPLPIRCLKERLVDPEVLVVSPGTRMTDLSELTLVDRTISHRRTAVRVIVLKGPAFVQEVEAVSDADPKLSNIVDDPLRLMISIQGGTKPREGAVHHCH